MTLNIDRNNNGGYGETQLKIALPKNAFSFSTAKYNGTLIDSNVPEITVPINATTARIVNV